MERESTATTSPKRFVTSSSSTDVASTGASADTTYDSELEPAGVARYGLVGCALGLSERGVRRCAGRYRRQPVLDGVVDLGLRPADRPCGRGRLRACEDLVICDLELGNLRPAGFEDALRDGRFPYGDVSRRRRPAGLLCRLDQVLDELPGGVLALV